MVLPVEFAVVCAGFYQLQNTVFIHNDLEYSVSFGSKTTQHILSSILGDAPARDHKYSSKSRAAKLQDQTKGIAFYNG